MRTVDAVSTHLRLQRVNKHIVCQKAVKAKYPIIPAPAPACRIDLVQRVSQAGNLEFKMSVLGGGWPIEACRNLLRVMLRSSLGDGEKIE